ncbi:hypothetical protein V1283_003769 [Bradyrhizobium sp. AZCC 2262]|uniref:hypothetical protein n=1 Tax=Bradyrhizobium sp. AZCC 2262 TaxID=3117022 RepID=UPI002FF195C4
MFASILKVAPYDIEVDIIDGCPAVTVNIAECPDRNKIVSVVCELAQTNICAEPCWEFSFSIDVFALDGCIEPFRTHDRQMAAPYIPAEIRGKIMDVVCHGLLALIEHANCGLIYRVTKDRDPTENSLKKHHLLTETLENAGYSVLDEGTDPFDRRFWLMQRPD